MFKNTFPLIFPFISPAFIGLLLLSITACSSKKNPVIYYNNFDFSQVKTYSFYTSGSDFFDSQNLSHAQRSGIELAIEKSLDKQDFEYSELNKADLIITYHLVKNQPQDYISYNKSVRFCAHCLKANNWKQENNNWSLYPGGLIIDLVDPKRKRSVWRSIYPLNFETKDNSAALNEKVLEAVDNMLTQYPGK